MFKPADDRRRPMPYPRAWLSGFISTSRANIAPEGDMVTPSHKDDFAPRHHLLTMNVP
jgi:hypothetical protein